MLSRRVSEHLRRIWTNGVLERSQCGPIVSVVILRFLLACEVCSRVKVGVIRLVNGSLSHPFRDSSCVLQSCPDHSSLSRSILLCAHIYWNNMFLGHTACLHPSEVRAYSRVVSSTKPVALAPPRSPALSILQEYIIGLVCLQCPPAHTPVLFELHLEQLERPQMLPRGGITRKISSIA